MRKTKEEAQVTRQKLLDAALKMFSQDGYSATRLENVAQEAGVTRGAVYHHFGNKASLYNALLRERFARALRVIDQAYAEGQSPLQNLRQVMVRTLEYLEEDPDYRAVQELAILKTGHIPELEEGLQAKVRGMRGYRRRMVEIIQRAIAQGEARADLDPDSAALAAIGLLNGVVVTWLLDPRSFSLKARAKGIVDTFLEGIVP